MLGRLVNFSFWGDDCRSGECWWVVNVAFWNRGWWMSGVVNVWLYTGGGERLGWWTSDFTMGVVNVWGGECLGGERLTIRRLKKSSPSPLWGHRVSVNKQVFWGVVGGRDLIICAQKTVTLWHPSLTEANWIEKKIFCTMPQKHWDTLARCVRKMGRVICIMAE